MSMCTEMCIFSHEFSEEFQQQSYLSLVMQAFVGAGVMGLPWVYKSLGLVLGSLTIVILGTMFLYR